MNVIITAPEFSNDQKNNLKSLFPGVTFIDTKDGEDFDKYLPDADVWITTVGKVTEDRIHLAKNLKLMQATFTGVDSLPQKLISEKGIILTKRKGVHGEIMSDYAIWAITQWHNSARLLYCQQQQRKWQQLTYREIYGSTIGILGLGEVGKAIARKAKAFGMNVIGMKTKKEQVPYVDEVLTMEEKDILFQKSDYVVMLLPMTEQTVKFCDWNCFSKMKNTALFINIGRGRTVDQEALIKALSEGEIAGAVLDVFEKEPLPEDNPLWEMSNVIITPHISGWTSDMGEKTLPYIIENLDRFSKGQDDFINQVNLERGY